MALFVRVGVFLGLLAGLVAGTAARAENITVTHWGGQLYGAPYTVAMKMGFFQAHGVDVTGILTAAGGGTAVRNTLAGGIPFGEVSLAAAVQAMNAGQKLVIVGAGVTTVADQLWVVKKGSPLHGIRDLMGKRVSYTSPGSVSNMVILMALKANGMSSKDVQLVPAGDLGANLAAVAGGAVDAAFTDEAILAKNEALVEPLFFVRDVMSPKMMQTVLITAAEYARAHPEVIRGLIQGRREGLDYMAAHPDESGDIVAAAYNNPDTALYRSETRKLLGLGYWSDGRLDYEGMNAMLEGLRITGQLKGEVDWSKYVDTSYLPADLRAAR